MTKHYILSLDPNAKYEWDRCTLRDPITAEHPALADLVAQAVGEQSGSYLVALNIQVTVLEQANPQTDRLPNSAVEAIPSRSPLPQFAELVA
ncbi:hypothetical protein ACN4EK_15440 [Pantanalinema rosaneae CENA516]|uniref:hypothetical protein n=1 Tax=Pantanalinema rosaneae TaxID=1620701 RepID=UPI003D6F5EBD